MVCRLIDFALMVLKLLMFKIFAIIDISKIEIFKVSGTERVNGNDIECAWIEVIEKTPRI